MEKLRYPNIEAERARAGMTKQELEKAIGMNPNTLKKFQAGQSDIRASQIVALAKLFNVSADYLLGVSLAERPQGGGIRTGV